MATTMWAMALKRGLDSSETSPLPLPPACSLRLPSTTVALTTTGAPLLASASFGDAIAECCLEPRALETSAIVVRGLLGVAEDKLCSQLLTT